MAYEGLNQVQETGNYATGQMQQPDAHHVGSFAGTAEPEVGNYATGQMQDVDPRRVGNFATHMVEVA